jgi:hypothetical protein
MKMRIKRSVAVLLVLSFHVFLFACGGGDGGASATSDAVSGAAGIFTINTSGADGGPNGGSGGDGGYVGIYMPSGSLGALQVMASGAADASFTPTVSTANLGDNPLNIMVDTTITVEAAEPAVAGTPYLLMDNSNVYISDGDPAPDIPVTGISVAAGTTLTLELNWNGGNDARVDLSNDIDNHGTITTDNNGALRGNLILYLASYHGNSTIDTSGTQPGQHGGFVEINPVYYFFNHGTINTSGADSSAGAAGDGGDVVIHAFGGYGIGIENTGNITANGGTASAGGTSGGNSGHLDWQTQLSIHNSGNLSCRGGDGVESGGDSHGMYFAVNAIGNFRNSGDMDASGGAASDSDPDSISGWGDSIYIYVNGGDIVNSGNLTTKGGDTTDPDSNGGSAGDIYLYVSYSSFGGTDAPAGDILFSGNVDASGGLAVTDAGATRSGGSGGSFEIEGDYDSYPSGQRIALLGYAGIDASGGGGNYGGSGGDVELSCEYGYVYLTDGDSPSCNITNEADVNAAGGSVLATATTPAYGGSGGSVNIWTDQYYGMFDPDLDKVANSGDIDTSGGDSLEATNYGPGNAGYVWIWGFNGVANSGNITARGGDDLGTDGGNTGYGNNGSDVQIYASLGPVSNSGNLTADGGDGEYRGGYAGDEYGIELFGPQVSNSGALAASGGDADPSLAGSAGGDGYFVVLFSPDGMQGITQTGTVTNDGGTGQTPGSDGDYYLGGQLL